MPIHDWTRVKAGIFHDFHHAWIEETKRALNRSILPPDFYALAEQFAGGYGPDVVALEGPTEPEIETDYSRIGVALAEVQPKTSFHAMTEEDYYITKANHIGIRHVSDHRVVAVIEIVSPGNKNSRGAFDKFIDKAIELLNAGIHLMVIDPFPPGPRDPEGIQHAIWGEMAISEFVLPRDRPLTIGSYSGGIRKEVFVESVAVGSRLPEMPLFLTAEVYVPVPLETTYQAAWQAVPPIWQKVLEGPKQDK